MTRTLRRPLLSSFLWVLAPACHDEGGGPSRPAPTAPVFPVTTGEAGGAMGATETTPAPGPGLGQDTAAGAADAGGGPPDAAALDVALRDGGGSQAAGPHDAAPEAGPGDGSAIDAEASVTGRCRSGRQWDAGTRGSALMTPGQPCLGCHGGSQSYFSFAGTLFAAAHEPDDCFGVVANGAEIVILGAGGQRLTLTPNAAGNFIANTNLPGPYTVEIRYQGRTRTKTQRQRSGDCNSCHSEQGAGGAAGRITLP
jgi:hypothetical protein